MTAPVAAPAGECRPPAAAAHRRYHWIENRGQPLVAAWQPSQQWKRIGRTTALTPAEAFGCGWRYVRFCDPPTGPAESPYTNDEVETVRRLIATLPDGAAPALQRFADQVCDEAERLQMPPRQTAAALAGVFGSLALVEARGDVADDATIGDFLVFAMLAMQVGVAAVRVARGWSP